jgi:hypothetical protein
VHFWLLGTTQAASRRIDPETNEIYNLQFRPPPAEVVGRLVVRQYDDDRASFQVRLDTYHAHIRRILPVFEGKIWTVDGMRAADLVFADLKRCFEVGPTLAPHVPPPVDVPHSFMCPISLEVMSDPVTCSDGHSYERAYIDEWLATSDTSPRTGARLANKSLIPAHALRMAIDEWGEGNGASDPTTDAHGGAGADSQATAAGASSRPPTTMDEIADGSLANSALNGEWPEEPPHSVAGGGADPDDEDWPDVEPSPNTAAGGDGGNGGNGGNGVQVSATVEPVAIDAAEGSPTVARSVVISIDPHDSVGRSPSDICCVIDVSGSMGSMAMYETEDGQTKHDGLNILDLVKHAITAIAHILGPEDRLAVVPFSTTATTCCPLTLMTEEGPCHF